jgi:UDP-N-acetyl-D-glucosamine dehydrogenase
VSAADPHVVEEIRALGDRVRRVELTEEEVATADAVVLLSDHDEFDYELVRTHARYVLDTRRRIHGANVDAI